MLHRLLEARALTPAAALPAAWRAPVAPAVAAVRARIEALTPIAAAQADLDPPLDASLLDALFDMGLFSLTVPAAAGGMDASLRDFVLTMESVGRLGPAYAMTAVPHLCISVKAVASLVPPPAAERILRDIRARRRLLAFAITEDQGSDVAAVKCRLTRGADGRLYLSGRKQWITNLRRAGHVVVVALCPPLHPAPGATAMVLVSLEQKGVSVSRALPKLCVNGSDTAEIFFDGVLIEPDNVLGVPGRGMALFNEMVLPGRLGAAAAAIGMARAALDDAVARDDSPLSAELHQELDSALAVLSDCVALTAALGDAGRADLTAGQGPGSSAASASPEPDSPHPDFPHLVALAKHFCAREAQHIAQRIDRAYAARGEVAPPVVRRACRAMGLFRLLKGPGEILALQAVSALTAQLSEPNVSSAFEGRPLRLGLQALSKTFAALAGRGGPSANPVGAAALAEAAAACWCLFAAEMTARGDPRAADAAVRRRGRRWVWRQFTCAWREAERLAAAPGAAELDRIYLALRAAVRADGFAGEAAA